MNSQDYWSPDPEAPDRFYSQQAAVLRDFEFDRVRYKVAGSTYRSTDLTHWLALEVASRALADAGLPGGEGLPRESTGVVLGNSLTGEFSRANLMRLRWPYVRRTVAAELVEKGWGEDETATFLGKLEQRYKAPFPGPGWNASWSRCTAGATTRSSSARCSKPLAARVIRRCSFTAAGSGTPAPGRPTAERPSRDYRPGRENHDVREDRRAA